MNLVDSSGWLEYLSDAENADFFAPAIEDQENLIVSTINIFEVFKKIVQQRDENSALQVIALMKQGDIKNVDLEISLLAAKLSDEFGLPMADSLILATSQIHKAIFWTQDSYFRKISDVKYIRKG